MLTIFAHLKAFQAPFDVIQRNAIASWVRLRPAPEILLFGDAPGAAEVAEEFGARYVPEVLRSEFGRPFIHDVLDKAQRLASYDLLCHVNADIILLQDFMQAVDRVRRWPGPFLLAGRRWDVEITAPLDVSQDDWEADVRRFVRQTGRLNAWGTDYFVFPRGLYRHFPPMTFGRGFSDGVLIRIPRALGAPIIDATPVVMCVHQDHPGGSVHTHGEPIEVWRNYVLAGGCRHWFLFEATHRMTAGGVRRIWGQKLAFQARSLATEWLIYRTGPIRHRLGLRRATLQRFRRRLGVAR